MPERRNFFLILLVALLFFSPSLARCDTPTNPTRITVVTTPTPYMSQLISGDKCVFNVSIQNLSVIAPAGQVVNASDPTVKYTGNFTVETTFELRKQGNLYYAGQSVGYTTSLNNTQIDNYYSVVIPDINGIIKSTFTYNLTKGYEILGVRPDENMVLYFKINVFVQTYSDRGGKIQFSVGKYIQGLRKDYYIIDFVKQEYLKGKFFDIRLELSQLKNINSAHVQIGKDYYKNLLNNINTTLTSGNYVYALDLINNYYEYEEPKLINLLYSNLNSTGGLADKYNVISGNYTTLSGQYSVLRNDYENVLATNQVQEERINQLAAEIQTNKQDYIIMLGVSLSLLFLVGYIFGRRPRF